MLIASKDRTTLVNVFQMSALYVGESGKIRAVTGNSSYNIGGYATKEVAEVAMEMVIERLKAANEVALMPTEQEVEIRMRASSTKERAANGKKTVRHGGS